MSNARSTVATKRYPASLSAHSNSLFILAPYSARVAHSNLITTFDVDTYTQ